MCVIASVDPGDVMNEREAHETWAAISKLGKKRFAWAHRVLPIGLPTGVFIAMVEFWLRGMSIGDIASKRGMALIYVPVVVLCLGAYVYGMLEWDELETKANSSRAKED